MHLPSHSILTRLPSQSILRNDFGLDVFRRLFFGPPNFYLHCFHDQVSSKHSLIISPSALVAAFSLISKLVVPEGVREIEQLFDTTDPIQVDTPTDEDLVQYKCLFVVPPGGLDLSSEFIESVVPYGEVLQYPNPYHCAEHLFYQMEEVTGRETTVSECTIMCETLGLIQPCYTEFVVDMTVEGVFFANFKCEHKSENVRYVHIAAELKFYKGQDYTAVTIPNQENTAEITFIHSQNLGLILDDTKLMQLETKMTRTQVNCFLPHINLDQTYNIAHCLSTYKHIFDTLDHYIHRTSACVSYRGSMRQPQPPTLDADIYLNSPFFFYIRSYHNDIIEICGYACCDLTSGF